MKIAGVIFITLVLCGLTFLCVDCSAGKTRHLECYVADKERVAAWTEIHTSVDSDGNTHISTQYHPEEFRLICQEYGADLVRVNVGESFYREATNGQPVTIRVRVGKWTGINHLARIEP